ncbi:MAG: SPOR domain-containing protein [Campylobacterota bacterium]|nr:SPOR domain-containing protein [Campylobacterota bacterium]
MKVDGKEFMRNVGIEQERDGLIKEQQKLESQKRDAIQRDQDYMADNNIDENDSAYIDLSLNNTPPIDESENVIQDIRLEPEDPNKTKKKYIILGIGLILTFVITILVIRLISNNDVEQTIENLNPETKELNRDKILDKIDTNEEYQKVIDKNSYVEDSEKSNTDTTKNEINEIVIPGETSQNTPIVIDTPKPKVEPKRDLFGLDNTVKKTEVVEVKPKTPTPVKVEKVVKLVKKEITKPAVEKKSAPKRKIVVASPVETNFTKNSANVSGYYIQIGAFTKKPSDKLLNSISKKGYKYTIHTMRIKGKVYNKVLIGSYNSRANATKLLNKVKKDFNNKNAYILKF